MRLKGKVAIVTGGTRGLGARIARAYLDEGARVVIAGRDAGPAAELLEQAGDDAAFHPVEVRSAESAGRLMDFAADRFGGVDIVVANAGVSRPGRVSALSSEDWTDVVETNLTGTFTTARAAIEPLRASGSARIITMSSALGSRVAPGASAYCATKAAVEMFTKVLAVELGPEGITVNSLSPGLIDEGMGKLLAANAPVWETYQPKLASGRLGMPEEVASAAVFLASEESSYVSGHVLEVNGALNW